MKIAITGASGLIGSAVVEALERAGHEVVRLVRREPAPGAPEARWDPEAGNVDTAPLAGCEAAIHLAGENIGAGAWTAERKERIRKSRVEGTRVFVEALASLDPKPRTLLSASAIGYYGDRGDELLHEGSPPGEGFLPEVAKAWEEEALRATDHGIRVACMRFGVVLSARGGALARMLLPFRLGLGGRVGSGRQYWSWVALDEIPHTVAFLLEREDLSGPVNIVAPEPVRNAEFTRVLARVLRRPAFFPLPAFAARLMLGEMADELLLASTRVEPRKLREAGYTFRFPELEGALRHVLGRPAPSREPPERSAAS